MKITLDIDKLFEEGKIDVDDYETLKGFAHTETSSLALNILIGFGVIAVSGGMVALVASAGASAAIGVLIAAVGVYLGIYYSDSWNLLGSILLVVGALIFGGGTIAYSEGGLAGFVILAIIYLAVGFVADSGLIIALGTLSLWGAIGATGGYGHATYSFGTDKPLVSILLFSLIGSERTSRRNNWTPETHVLRVFFPEPVFLS